MTSKGSQLEGLLSSQDNILSYQHLPNFRMCKRKHPRVALNGTLPSSRGSRCISSLLFQVALAKLPTWATTVLWERRVKWESGLGSVWLLLLLFFEGWRDDTFLFIVLDWIDDEGGFLDDLYFFDDLSKFLASQLLSLSPQFIHGVLGAGERQDWCNSYRWDRKAPGK